MTTLCATVTSAAEAPADPLAGLGYRAAGAADAAMAPGPRRGGQLAAGAILPAAQVAALEDADTDGGIVSEIRAGLLYHDPGILVSRREEGIDGNAEILFESPGFLDIILSPRPHLGFSINSAGDTSQVYAGLSWTWYPWDFLFLEFSFGGSLHNGELDAGIFSDKKSFGCRVLFRESASLGIQFLDDHNLSVMVGHISNGGLCNHNNGLDTVGLRYGFRF